MTPEGLEPEPKLMEAIDKLTPPTSVTEVRSFLGLVGYYRRFIKGEVRLFGDSFCRTVRGTCLSLILLELFFFLLGREAHRSENFVSIL